MAPDMRQPRLSILVEANPHAGKRPYPALRPRSRGNRCRATAYLNAKRSIPLRRGGAQGRLGNVPVMLAGCALRIVPVTPLTCKPLPLHWLRRRCQQRLDGSPWMAYRLVFILSCLPGSLMDPSVVRSEAGTCLPTSRGVDTDRRNGHRAAVSGNSPIVCQPYRLTRNGGNGSGGVRIAKAPIVWDLYRGAGATQWKECLRSRPDRQSAHCWSTPGGRG